MPCRSPGVLAVLPSLLRHAEESFMHLPMRLLMQMPRGLMQFRCRVKRAMRFSDLEYSEYAT